MSAEDCARQRFIVWAAVRRNRSVRMAATERLRCPLLRCGEHFNQHEEMLRHLAQCQHLATGEYVCYDCMKVERFNDKKCRCCVGQPTKRRRIINMAKNFFANIGSARVRREEFSASIQDADFSQPPSYDTLTVNLHEQYDQYDLGEVVPPEGAGRLTEQQELNGTELLELDSRPLIPSAELEAADHDSRHSTQATPDLPTKTNEAHLLDGPPILSKPCQQPSRFQAAFTSQGGTSGSGSRRPSLALNTRVDSFRTKARATYLSPSSSLRSNSHGISPVTPWSASSESSTIWSTASHQDNNVLASPITPLSASVHSSAPQTERLLSTKKDTDTNTCPKDPFQYMLGGMPELPGDSRLPFELPPLPSDPLACPYDSKDDYSWISSINTALSLDTSVNMMFTDPSAKTVIPADFLEAQIPSSETKTLVEHVWGTLRVHFSDSLSKLSRIRNNALADSLRVQTPRTIASAGFMRLKRILSRTYPSRPEPLEYICFIHLVYSISLVMHGDGLLTWSNKLYDQAMAYGVQLDAAYRDNYYQVVATIWQQHPQASMTQRSRESTDRIAENKGKEPDYRHHASSVSAMRTDALEIIGQHFLDGQSITIVPHESGTETN
jgi:hypothetical protein